MSYCFTQKPKLVSASLISYVFKKTLYSAVHLIQALLIQISDYGTCLAHCIYALYLRQIHN